MSILDTESPVERRVGPTSSSSAGKSSGKVGTAVGVSGGGKPARAIRPEDEESWISGEELLTEESTDDESSNKLPTDIRQQRKIDRECRKKKTRERALRHAAKDANSKAHIGLQPGTEERLTKIETPPSSIPMENNHRSQLGDSAMDNMAESSAQLGKDTSKETKPQRYGVTAAGYRPKSVSMDSSMYTTSPAYSRPVLEEEDEEGEDEAMLWRPKRGSIKLPDLESYRERRVAEKRHSAPAPQPLPEGFSIGCGVGKDFFAGAALSVSSEFDQGASPSLELFAEDVGISLPSTDSAVVNNSERNSDSAKDRNMISSCFENGKLDSEEYESILEGMLDGMGESTPDRNVDFIDLTTASAVDVPSSDSKPIYSDSTSHEPNLGTALERMHELDMELELRSSKEREAVQSHRNWKQNMFMQLDLLKGACAESAEETKNTERFLDLDLPIRRLSGTGSGCPAQGDASLQTMLRPATVGKNALGKSKTCRVSTALPTCRSTTVRLVATSRPITSHQSASVKRCKRVNNQSALKRASSMAQPPSTMRRGLVSRRTAKSAISGQKEIEKHKRDIVEDKKTVIYTDDELKRLQLLLADNSMEDVLPLGPGIGYMPNIANQKILDDIDKEFRLLKLNCKLPWNSNLTTTDGDDLACNGDAALKDIDQKLLQLQRSESLAVECADEMQLDRLIENARRELAVSEGINETQADNENSLAELNLKNASWALPDNVIRDLVDEAWNSMPGFIPRNYSESEN